MGDEKHAILACASFNDKRDKLLAHLGEKYPMFKTFSNYDKMFFILTCEGESAIKVYMFLLKTVSSQRPNFSKTTKKINDLQLSKC